MFLRAAEFLWQEGTYCTCNGQAVRDAGCSRSVADYAETMAVPVIKGMADGRSFPGRRLSTYTPKP